MNLLDSHDTERLLWTLTPGAETRADKEQNAPNVAAGDPIGPSLETGAMAPP